MWKKRLLAFALSAAVFTGTLGITPPVCAASGSTYYVSPSGSDANDGSSASPWQTLGKAAAEMRPGDTCIVGGGTYHETLTPPSGTEGAPVTFKAKEGETVVISGANEVTGFVRHEGEIFVANATLTLGDGNQVFVDGDMGFNARWPNTKTGEFYTGFAEVESGSNTTIQDPALEQFGDGFFEGATLWVNAGSRWTSQTADVLDHTGDTITFTPLGLTDVQNTPVKGNPYYLSNVYGALDSENEWYYDAAQNKLYLYGDPTGKTVQVKARETAIDLTNTSHVTIDGINVLGASITGTGTSYITLNRVNASYAAHASRIVNPYGTDVASIKLFGDHNVISNCEVAYSSATGVWLSGDENLLFNSSIHDTDYIGSYGACINVSGNGNVISHNTAYNTGRDIIIFQSGERCRIEYNDFSHSGMICADLGVFYTVATDGGGTEICYNWFHDNDSSGSKSGIYLDNGTSNWLIHHNVVWNAGTALQLNVPSNYIAAYNNTLIGNINQDFAWVFKDDTWGGRVVNNLVVGSIGLKPETIAYGNLKGADPGFTDAAEHDYTLTAASPAIDMAQSIPGITDEFSGAGPDLGAYEYGVEAWKAGCDPDNPPTMPQTPVQVTHTRYANLVENAGFETAGLAGWTISGPVTKATPGAGHDPIQMDNGYTRTGYGSAKLTGSDAPVQSDPLSEDFSGGDLSAWSCDAFGTTQFEIVDEALELGNIPGTAGECRVLYTGENYQDAVYEATIRIMNDDTGSQELGMVTRYMSSESYLFFSYAPWRKGSGATFEIARRVGTSYQRLNAGPGTLEMVPGEEYNIRIEMNGMSLKWYVNGELQVEAEDESPASGKIGVGQYLADGTGRLRYDDVVVTPISEIGQTTAVPSQPQPETQPAPTEPQPETQPAPTEPQPDAEPAPTEPQPEAEPAPTEPQPEAEPAPAEPQPDAEPAPAEPQPEAEPAPAEPQPEAEPAPAEPQPEAEPAPAEPQPEAEPAPAEPQPEAEPAPAEPQPEAEPAPAEPQPEVDTGSVSPLSVRSAGGRGMLLKTISVQPDTTYTLTAWIKVEPGEEMKCGIRGGDTVTVAESAGGVWTRHQVEYTTASGETELTIWFEKVSDGPNAVYVDDVGLMEKEAPLENTAQPQRVALSSTAATISVKDALQLTATVLPFDASVQEVEWASSDPSVATVNAEGSVLGMKNGNALITASVKGYPQISASCTVTVAAGAQYNVYDLTDDLANEALWKSDGAPRFGSGQVEVESMKTLASAGVYENGMLFHLRMKLDFQDTEWYGVGVSSTRPLNYAWSDNGLYHLVIKESQFELQKWGNGGGGANQVVVENNGLVKDGEFFDFKMGAIPENGAMRVVVEVNGQRIMSWLDTADPFDAPGYLNFYNQGTGTMVLAAPEQEELPPDPDDSSGGSDGSASSGDSSGGSDGSASSDSAETEGDAESSDVSSADTSVPTSPKTGDSFPCVMLAITAAACLTALGLLGYQRLRARRKE